MTLLLVTLINIGLGIFVTVLMWAVGMPNPLFVGRMFTINPIMVFLSVLGWGWLWGMAGVFMAVPLLMIGKIVWDQSREAT